MNKLIRKKNPKKLIVIYKIQSKELDFTGKKCTFLFDVVATHKVATFIYFFFAGEKKNWIILHKILDKKHKEWNFFFAII